MIGRMNQHVVVCGGGVTAQTVIAKMVAEGTPVVAVTNDPEEIDAIMRISPETPVVRDDPQSEMALVDSNAMSAKVLDRGDRKRLRQLADHHQRQGLGNEHESHQFRSQQ